MKAVRRPAVIKHQLASPAFSTTATRGASQYGGMAANIAQQKFDINTKYSLNSGYEIPALGYGVYQTPAAVTESVSLHAFRTGYRHIDSARGYRNEQPCADAIRASGLDRSDIFFTSKVPPRAMGYEAAKKSIESSFAQTNLDYIDLYLIHAPYGGPEARKETWRALIEARSAGKIRSLGVSNYGVHHLDELESYMKELKESGKECGTLDVGQWELHPWLKRDDIVRWCKERNVVVEAYCPLVRGQKSGDSTLAKVAEKHGKTWAQVLVRWSLQEGFVPLPKSVTPSRIEENENVYDFELSEEDMKSLDFGTYEPCAWDPTKATINE